MVPWTMSAPAITPSSELATASSQSLWVWMPTRAGLCASASAARTAATPLLTWSGRLPPLVSHSTTHDAPARAAARHASTAYSESRAKPSKKCSASKTSSLPAATPNATDSSIMARCSPFVVPRTLATCQVSLLPTRVHTGAPLAAERSQSRVSERLRGKAREQLFVLGVGAGEAALDVVELQVVEQAPDALLVRGRERDLGSLRAVAQGRVVDDDPSFRGHK